MEELARKVKDTMDLTAGKMRGLESPRVVKNAVRDAMTSYNVNATTFGSMNSRISMQDRSLRKLHDKNDDVKRILTAGVALLSGALLSVRFLPPSFLASLYARSSVSPIYAIRKHATNTPVLKT